MPREYPRFIFSDPKDKKTSGPYVIHCLSPRGIYKIHFGAGAEDHSHTKFIKGRFTVKLLEAWEVAHKEKIEDIEFAIERWLLSHQI